MNENIFDNEFQVLMFYHTTLRNIIGLTTFSFVLMNFSNNLKFKTNEIIFKSIGLVMCCLAFYFNFSLINMFTNITKKKIYIKKYLIVNYSFYPILIILKIFIIFSLYMLITK